MPVHGAVAAACSLLQLLGLLPNLLMVDDVSGVGSLY